MACSEMNLQSLLNLVEEGVAAKVQASSVVEVGPCRSDLAEAEMARVRCFGEAEAGVEMEKPSCVQRGKAVAAADADFEVGSESVVALVSRSVAAWLEEDLAFDVENRSCVAIEYETMILTYFSSCYSVFAFSRSCLSLCWIHCFGTCLGCQRCCPYLDSFSCSRRILSTSHSTCRPGDRLLRSCRRSGPSRRLLGLSPPLREQRMDHRLI